MYIRRKVFSLLQDENGEEKYFSTTEFVRENSEEKLFAKKEAADKAKDATVKGAKKVGNFIERAWKGETNGFSRDAQGYARKNGRFAKESAMKKNAYKNRALMIGGTAATVATPIVAAKLAKKNKKENKD